MTKREKIKRISVYKIGTKQEALDTLFDTVNELIDAHNALLSLDEPREEVKCADCGHRLDGENCAAGGVHDLPTQSKEDWEVEFDERKVGGKIHKILNESFVRKLTIAEYKRLVKLIGSVFNAFLTAKQEGAERAVEYIKNSGYKIESVSGKMVGIEAHISILEQAKTAYKNKD